MSLLSLKLKVTHGVNTLLGVVRSLMGSLQARATSFENAEGSQTILNEFKDNSLLDSASILLTPTSIGDAEINSIKPIKSFGSELVSQPNFQNQGSWFVSNDNQGTISGGTATIIGNGSNKFAQWRHSFTVSTSKKYELIVTISATNHNVQIDAYSGASGFPSNNSAQVGTHNFRFTPTATTFGLKIGINNNANGNATLTFVSLKEVTDADFDFTRATTATRVNSSGLIESVASGLPRIDFTDGTGNILIEPALTNLDVTAADLSTGWGASTAATQQVETGITPFGVSGNIKKVSHGPVVTLNEFEPAAGVKVSKIINLSDDIARNTSSESARISTIPGSNTVGIELPNSSRENVYLSEILNNSDFKKKEIKLPIALGKSISGNPIVGDLSSMPHLLIAGTTGSGKSVCINTIILSLLYRHTPERCKFILIDPKMLELSTYEGVPHLLCPVITEAKKAASVLGWVVKEMESRYRLMTKEGVRNIDGYNSKHKLPMPYIVVVVDEMSDLMLVAGKEIENYIQKLSQMARAAGIHIIMATQRPSVDVITGTIKANFPTRISFQVTSKIDSRTILGEQGAEQLLGKGDMLYMSSANRVIRIHAPFVSDNEIENINNSLRSQAEPDYVDEILNFADEKEIGDGSKNMGDKDELYQTAVEIIKSEGKASTSFLQRKLQIGYNRAARIIDMMEEEGVVSKANHVGKRDVL